MKLILSYCCFMLALAGVAKAQAVSRVIYDFYHLRDTTNKAVMYREETILYAGEGASLYTSYTKMKQDSANARAFAEAQRTGNMHINLGTLLPYNEEQIYFLQAENKVTVLRPFNLNNYVIPGERPAISWTILPDTATILGYLCQQATGSWKGRQYTAWFTTDLPYNAGPWKLQGLPGLILKAVDSRSEVMFLCKSISLQTGDHPSLLVPGNAIVTTMKDFQRMVKAYQERQMAQAADSDFKVAVTSAPAGKNRKIVFNNPIEIEQ